MVHSLPPSVRRAGVVVAAEGAVALIVAVVLVIAGINGADPRVAYGTAGWFTVVGAAVLAAGVGLLRGSRWGRGLAVFAQLLLLPIAWYMAVGSHRPELGVPVALVAAVALASLFSPATLRWAAGAEDETGDETDDTGGRDAAGGQDPASADSSGPDRR